MPGAYFEGSFEFIAHTADIAVRVRGRTETALFQSAARAFTETLTDRAAVLEKDERLVRLASTELDLLLVDWLEELLFLFETEAFLVREADVTITSDDEYVIASTLRGEARDLARHPLKILIKGVTYHGLHIQETADGYEVIVIFDI